MARIALLSFFVFLSACSEVPKNNSVVQSSPTPKTELKKDIPNDSWVRIYFEDYENKAYQISGSNRKEITVRSSGINSYAAENGLSMLTETVLPDNDLEVRVWVGFGKYGKDGLILRRASGIWSAINLRGMLCHLDKRGKYSLPPPKSGWETMWQKLVNAEVLTLPDASKLNYEYSVPDGKSYVVETNFDNLYRTYNYNNPSHEKVREAGQMVKIGQIIADEFDLESFSSETNGCVENE